MASLFVVTSGAGPKRDLSKGSRLQAFWDDHAAYIDGLVAGGLIVLGGPFADGGAMIVVKAESESAVRELLAHDPWYLEEILTLQTIREWEIFIDEPR